MKKVLKKIKGKYKYRWVLDFDDWCTLVVIALALNYIMFRLIIKG